MKPIQKFNKALWYVILFCALGYAFTYFNTERLPDRKEILRPLYQQPKQEPIEIEPFVKEYDDKKYMIRPHFEYDIYGLVVSYRNLDETWFNIYYDDDPYNIKDLCVIWGGNLIHDDYKRIKYSSGMWTCYFSWRDVNLHFNESEISNNHILPENEAIAKLLKQARTGDQVHFKGYLVDYSVIGGGGGERKTSTVRFDTGDHACEVVYVKEFEILKDQNSLWRFFNSLSFGMIILAGILKIYIFFVF